MSNRDIRALKQLNAILVLICGAIVNARVAHTQQRDATAEVLRVYESVGSIRSRRYTKMKKKKKKINARTTYMILYK